MSDSSSKINDQNKFSKKLDRIVANIVERKGYIESKVEKRRISSNGGNHLGTLSEICIQGTTNNGNAEENIFVKNIVTRNEVIISVSEVYKRELYVYKEIMKKFDKIQNEANVPIEMRYKIPKFYEESDEETILLENLSIKGFKTYYTAEIINIEFAKLAVRELAKFHGLSFVLIHKEPNYFDTNIKVLCDVLSNERFNEFLKQIGLESLKFLKEDVKEKYGNTILDRIIKNADRTRNTCNDERNIRTLCHGDYRHSNVMVKEVNGVPHEVTHVDYQLVHFGYPILDFFYFTFFGTDREFRRQHMTALKELYYESLKVFLAYFDLDVEKVFPRVEFEKEYKEKMDYGLLIGCVFLPIMFCTHEVLPDLSNPKDIANWTFEPVLRDRYRGLVQDFIDWGLLDE